MNQIINSPFYEPTRHFKFSNEGITNEVVDGRKISSYLVPIVALKKTGRSKEDLYSLQVRG